MSHPYPKRLSSVQARRIWRRTNLTGPQAIRKMQGWTLSAAYRELGKRDVRVGRRRKR